MSPNTPFGLEAPGITRPHYVLDKSYLDGASFARIQYLAQNGVNLLLPDALIHELVRKRDRQRTHDFFKLAKFDGNLFVLPGIGEMFRAEQEFNAPAPSILRAPRVGLHPRLLPSGELGLDIEALQSAFQHTDELNAGLPPIVEIWREF